ncbi:hypothetical protein SAMN04488564_1277 [Lentzea waywayandensis]|uniref:Uncharacterized protein n=1 Tax=Lentzea waywayandensis TaxID=84724 RepID=A0A1I6FJF8_9PSEU|nr:hypothetical protein SAMN04488564_1277 [Lentzea waywayandensis]
MKVIQQRMQYLMQTGEAQARLELGSSGMQDKEALLPAMCSSDLQQRGLADARLPGQQQCAALGRGAVDEREYTLHILFASNQFHD